MKSIPKVCYLGPAADPAADPAAVVIARRDLPVVSLNIVSEFSGKTRIGLGIISVVRMLSDGLASPPYRHHDEARIWMYSPMVARRIAALISSR